MRTASLLAFALLVGACDDTTTTPARVDASNDLAAEAAVDVAAPDDASDAADAPADVRPTLANPFSRGPYGTAVRAASKLSSYTKPSMP